MDFCSFWAGTEKKVRGKNKERKDKDANKDS